MNIEEIRTLREYLDQLSRKISVIGMDQAKRLSIANDIDSIKLILHRAYSMAFAETYGSKGKTDGR